MKIPMQADISENELVGILIDELNNAQLISFIKTIDAQVADLDFTRQLIIYFNQVGKDCDDLELKEQ